MIDGGWCIRGRSCSSAPTRLVTGKRRIYASQASNHEKQPVNLEIVPTATSSIRASETIPVQATEEERELVRKMIAGDEAAFDAFANHYIPALHRFAGSKLRGDPELTRDVVQSTICKVIDKLDTYRGEAALFVWLCRCCLNEIAGHYRRQKSRPTLVEADDETFEWTYPNASSSAPDPEQTLLGNETGQLVHLALDHLPPRYAAVLEWKYLEDASVNEIAERLQVGSKAAESVLTRARKAFRAIYEGFGDNPLALETR